MSALFFTSFLSLFFQTHTSLTDIMFRLRSIHVPIIIVYINKWCCIWYLCDGNLLRRILETDTNVLQRCRVNAFNFASSCPINGMLSLQSIRIECVWFQSVVGIVRIEWLLFRFHLSLYLSICLPSSSSINSITRNQSQSGYYELVNWKHTT